MKSTWVKLYPALIQNYSGFFKRLMWDVAFLMPGIFK